MDPRTIFLTRVCSTRSRRLVTAGGFDIRAGAARACVAVAAALAVALLSPASLAQTANGAQITGSITTVSTTDPFDSTFTCLGSPICKGIYSGINKLHECSNSFKISDAVTMSGFDLSQPGPIQGNITLANIDFSVNVNPDGSCSIKPGTINDATIAFTGTWNGTTASISATVIDPEGAVQVNGSFTIGSAANPVFPATISGSITPTAANITAAIQYRPQDVGANGSVYVFALAPSNKVANVSAAALSNHKGPVTRGTGTTTPATPLPCVLAQLTSNGQLTAATSSTLQAYLTGVLSSQGASVNVLNNVSTALLSGAVFYVGYGSNSTSMINTGTNRSVVTVPGTQTCQPQAPQTGWWWNAAQDGRGFGIEVRGNNLFMSGYLYDDTGHATWVVSPGPVALDGSLFNGTMYQVANGQTLTGNYKAPSAPTTSGPITLSFTDARNGTLIWPGGSIPIVRFDTVIGSGNGVTPSFVPENGWWWNENESGRGFFLEIKNNFMFIAGYMYEADGRPVWYVAQNPMTTPQTFSSTWLQVANGQTMTGPYKPPTIINSNVGSVSILFSDASHAVMTLPGGKQLAIARQRF